MPVCVLLILCHFSMVILWSYFTYIVLESAHEPSSWQQQVVTITIYHIFFILLLSSIFIRLEFSQASSILSCPYSKFDISLISMGENQYSFNEG